jgi:hypothetical protein
VTLIDRSTLPTHSPISVIDNLIKEVKALLWTTFAAGNGIKSSVPFDWLFGPLLACGLFLYVPSIALADDDDARPPAPRTMIVIGGASVSLFTANNQLYAFVDRLNDNTPVNDATLSVEIRDGASLTPTSIPIAMKRSSEGGFVGPLKRAGRSYNTFMVSLQSSAGSGDAPAQIIYTDAFINPAAIPPSGTSAALPIAGVAGGIGAVLAAMLVLWWTSWRKRRAHQ